MDRRPAADIRDMGRPAPHRARRHAHLAALVGFAAAAALPVFLWHHAMSLIASDFRLELGYLVTGWTGYGLIGLGLMCLVPVVATSGWQPERRPRRRNAYVGWGVSLYLLGAALASQVAAVASVP
jgi:MFS family permease